MPVQIHGNQYFTVVERLALARDAKATDELMSIITEVVPHNLMVICKATVTLKSGKMFTGISAANPSKPIEKMSPYEVAETSAVGRALGFAGYGVVDGIASADEIKKVQADVKVEQGTSDFNYELDITGEPLHCDYHDSPMWKNKNGKRYHKVNDEFCNGYGTDSEKERGL